MIVFNRSWSAIFLGIFVGTCSLSKHLAHGFIPATWPAANVVRLQDTPPTTKQISWVRTSKSSTLVFGEPSSEERDNNDIIGIWRGVYLLAVAIVLNIWLFSIPTEFRRAKMCSEEQVIQFPDSGCMTASQWVAGVQDYYASGGGVHFDFSIEKSRQPKWIGGEQQFQK